MNRKDSFGDNYLQLNARTNERKMKKIVWCVIMIIVIGDAKNHYIALDL